jgi:hypothetical protein
MEAIYPERMGGRVTVQFRDGSHQSRCVEIPRGEPENFPEDAVHRAKFLSLAEPVIGDAASELHQQLMSLDQQESVDALFAAAA